MGERTDARRMEKSNHRTIFLKDNKLEFENY
jgi:hypothetical protein